MSGNERSLSFDVFDGAPGVSTSSFTRSCLRFAERASCSHGAALRQLFRAISYSTSFCAPTRQSLTFVFQQPVCLHYSYCDRLPFLACMETLQLVLRSSTYFGIGLRELDNLRLPRQVAIVNGPSSYL
jgi:hypothetical protein